MARSARVITASGRSSASIMPIPMATLYLVFGPLLDFVYVMGVFALTLFIATRRLENGRGEQVWRWM